MRFVIKRLGQQPRLKIHEIKSAETIRDYWKEVVEADPTFEGDKEHLVVILLDSKHRAFGYNVVSMGTISETVAHPREILRPAVLAAARAFVLVHQHPSGDPTPSEADRKLTRRIAEAAALFQIPLVEHLIVGCEHEYPPGYWSFRKHTNDIIPAYKEL